MKSILTIGILLFVLIVAFATLGVALVWKRKIKDRGGRSYARLAATLMVAAAYWLTQKSKAAINLDEIDLALFLLLVLIVCFYFFWACIARSLDNMKLFNDSWDSSLLSMLYMDSRMAEMDYEKTVNLTSNPKGSGKKEH